MAYANPTTTVATVTIGSGFRGEYGWLSGSRNPKSAT